MRISDWSSDVCSSDLRREGDEELAVGGVGALRAGHADHATLEGLRGELGRQVGQVGAAAPGAGRVAGLRHEAVDNSVDHAAGVEAPARQLLYSIRVRADRCRVGKEVVRKCGSVWLSYH